MIRNFKDFYSKYKNVLFSVIENMQYVYEETTSSQSMTPCLHIQFSSKARLETGPQGTQASQSTFCCTGSTVLTVY